MYMKTNMDYLCMVKNCSLPPYLKTTLLTHRLANISERETSNEIFNALMKNLIGFELQRMNNCC